MVKYYKNEKGNQVIAASSNAFVVISNNAGMFNLQIFMFPFTNRIDETYNEINAEEFKGQYDIITSMVIDIFSQKGKGVGALLPDAIK